MCSGAECRRTRRAWSGDAGRFDAAGGDDGAGASGQPGRRARRDRRDEPSAGMRGRSSPGGPPCAERALCEVHGELDDEALASMLDSIPMPARCSWAAGVRNAASRAPPRAAASPAANALERGAILASHARCPASSTPPAPATRPTTTCSRRCGGCRSCGGSSIASSTSCSTRRGRRARPPPSVRSRRRSRRRGATRRCTSRPSRARRSMTWERPSSRSSETGGCGARRSRRRYALPRGPTPRRALAFAMELKVWRDGKNPLEEGLRQLDGYLDGLGLSTGWLVIFDRRRTREPDEVRIRRERASSPAGREITVVRA